MGLTDQILEKFGLKYEELDSAERETLKGWMDALDNNQMTLPLLQSFVRKIKSDIEQELANEPEYITVFVFKFRNDKNIFLKARLRNIMLLDAFMSSPQQAREALDRAIASIVANRPKGEVK